MPRTGTPEVSRPAGAGGAPGAYTEDGPPDKMIAAGFRASISAALIVDGTISEYTWHSRTRLAMSWAYCAPKSTTSTGPCPAPEPSCPFTRSSRPFAGLTAASRSCTASAYLGGRLGPCRLRTRRRLGDLDLGDPAAVKLGHGQPGAVQLRRFARLRQVPERGQQVAGHGLVRAVRQFDAGLLGEVVEVHQAVDLDLPCPQTPGRVPLHVIFILDVADQLFDQVFQGHDARRAAVLVDDDGQVRLVPAH